MESYLASRSKFISTAEPGEVAARELSDLTDEAVGALALTASSRLSERWALIALGGWGSGGLLPGSDLDLLVLSEAPPDRLKPFVEAVLYPLWDAGLKVGHQVRSPKQQLRAMKADLKTFTAALSARPFAGDTDWAEAAIAVWLKDAHKRRRQSLPMLAARPREGSPYLLEPDLKEGAGGRRDYDELTWTAAVVSGVGRGGLKPLVEAQVLSAVQAEELAQAARVTLSARWELQRAGLGDDLSLDAAASLHSVRAEEVQAALGKTAQLLEEVRTAVAGREPASCQPLSAEALFELLAAQEGGRAALERAAQAGRLEGLLPGFQALMHCRRPGLGHELTVGAHSIRAATLALGAADFDRALSRSLESIDDPRVLLLATLVHDAAKAEGGAGHAERGGVPAMEAARRVGLGPAEAADVARLVQLHLLLPETALREDLDDEDVILRCAGAIGDARLLAPLHALTAADSRATGPSTWSPWTATLVGTLVARVDRALSAEVDGAGLASKGESVRESCLAAMASSRPAERLFVTGAPLRYLASRDPGEVMRHASLVADLAAAPDASGALLEVTVGPAQGTHVVTIAAPDRPELLARLSGAMALSGLDILSVDAYGSSDGVALDSFIVKSATERPVDTETFVKLERLARAALRDRLELAVRLEERRRHYRPNAKGPVRVSTRQAGWATELSVLAPDRPGLLHDIAEAVYQSGLNINWAKVQTVKGTARDIFHLSGDDGGPVTDPGVLGHVAMRIRELL